MRDKNWATKSGKKASRSHARLIVNSCQSKVKSWSPPRVREKNSVRGSFGVMSSSRSVKSLVTDGKGLRSQIMKNKNLKTKTIYNLKTNSMYNLNLNLGVYTKTQIGKKERSERRSYFVESHPVKSGSHFRKRSRVGTRLMKCHSLCMSYSVSVVYQIG